MLISLNVCCDQHRSEAAKIEEVIARDTLSGWHECVSESGFELSAYSLSLSLHTGDSASLTTAGVETDPQDIPGHLVRGLSEQLGVQPPTPGNSNTEVNLISQS
jgi:hypothetical protein